MIILITNLTLNMSSKRDCENYILRLMRVIVTPIGVEFGELCLGNKLALAKKSKIFMRSLNIL